MSPSISEKQATTINSILPTKNNADDDKRTSIISVSVECCEDIIDTAKQQHQQHFKPSGIKFTLLFIGLLLGFFMAALDTTIIITAAGIISSEFNAVDQIGWIGSAYLLTLSGFQPVYCSVTDIIGQRISYSFCVLIFIIGSILCGVSNSMEMLIISRAVQGVGAAGLFTSVLVIICELFDGRTRAIYQGILGIALGTASLVGPLLGGYLADHGQWRWAFFLNIFVGIAIIILTLLFCRLPYTKKQQERLNGEKSLLEQLAEVDYASVVLLMPGAVCLLVGLQLGGERVSFTDPASLGLLCVGSTLIIGFVLSEVFLMKYPVFPRHFVMSRNNIAVLVGQFAGGSANNAIIYFVPLHFEIVKGDSAVLSACKLMPFFVAAVLGGLVAGIIVQRTGYYRFLLWFATAICIVGASLLQTSKLDTPEVLLYVFLGLMGLGNGTIMNVITIAGQAGIEKDSLTIATAHGQFMRIFGGAFGVNIAAVIFRYHTTNQMKYLERMTRSEVHLKSITALKSLHYMLRQRVEKICLEALNKIYLLVAIISGVAFISTLLIKGYYIMAETEANDDENQQAKEQDEQASI